MGKNFVLILLVPGHGLFLLLIKKYGIRPMSVQDGLKNMLYGRFRYVVAYFLFKQDTDIRYNLTDNRDYIQPSDLLLLLSVYFNTSHTQRLFTNQNTKSNRKRTDDIHHTKLLKNALFEELN